MPGKQLNNESTSHLRDVAESLGTKGTVFFISIMDDLLRMETDTPRLNGVAHLNIFTYTIN